MSDQSDSATEECPECGSAAVTTKGISINGNRSKVSASWDFCLDCEWEDK